MNKTFAFKDMNLDEILDSEITIDNPALERAIKKMDTLGESTGEKITSYDRMHHRHSRS